MPDKTIQWLVEQNWSSPIALLEIDGLCVAQSVIGFGEAAVQIRETEALFTENLPKLLWNSHNFHVAHKKISQGLERTVKRTKQTKR